MNTNFRGLDKALYYLSSKKYDNIIESCNEEINDIDQSNEDKTVDGNNVEMNGNNESEDEGISADDSQKDPPLNSGSGDSPQPVAKKESRSARVAEAKLLRATFYILSKQQEKAFEDLNDIIKNENASPKVRANALIKRASLFIQRCKDPQQDSLLSFKDFEQAIEIDPDNADVYHHRGQVIFKLLINFDKVLIRILSVKTPPSI